MAAVRALRGVFLFALFSALILETMATGPRVPIPPSDSTAGPLAPGLSTRLHDRLAARVLDAGEVAAGDPETGPREGLREADLARFYASRAFRPAWLDDRLDLAAAASLVRALRACAGDGLDPEDYGARRIESALGRVGGIRAAAFRSAAVKETPAPALAEISPVEDLELSCTRAFLACGRDLLRGRADPRSVFPGWGIPRRGGDPVDALRSGLSAGDVADALASLHPSGFPSDGLRAALSEYRAIERNGGWSRLAPGVPLRAGSRDPRVHAIRSVLRAAGDLVEDIDSRGDLYDSPLEAAMRFFQSRHGLAPDGAAGPATLAALAVSPARRVRQIEANLERERWTGDLGRRHVLVNIPEFRLSCVEDGREVLGMKIMVGRPSSPTPVCSSAITRFVTRPSWSVPPSLARRDVLARAKKDPGYLRRAGFRVFWDNGNPDDTVEPDEVDWSGVFPGDLPFRFVQVPGPANALGRVAFMFPNPFGIYLHDTPERPKFARDSRAVSAGCLRVEDPAGLADFLTEGMPGWGRARVDAVLAERVGRTVQLAEPVPIHILYRTAWLGGDGRVRFREDIYGKDEASAGTVSGEGRSR